MSQHQRQRCYNCSKGWSRTTQCLQSVWAKNPIAQKVAHFQELDVPLRSMWSLAFDREEDEIRYFSYALKHGLRAQNIQSIVWVAFFIFAMVSDPEAIRPWTIPFRFSAAAAGGLMIAGWRFCAVRSHRLYVEFDCARGHPLSPLQHSRIHTWRRLFYYPTALFVTMALVTCQVVRMGSRLPLSEETPYLTSTAGPLIAYVACSTMQAPWWVLVGGTGMSAIGSMISEALLFPGWTFLMTIQAIAWVLVFLECAVLAYMRELDERRLFVLDMKHPTTSTILALHSLSISASRTSSPRTSAESLSTSSATSTSMGGIVSVSTLPLSSFATSATIHERFAVWHDEEHESSILAVFFALAGSAALFSVQDASLESSLDHLPRDQVEATFLPTSKIRWGMLVPVPLVFAALVIAWASIDSWAWCCSCSSGHHSCTRYSLRLSCPWCLQVLLSVSCACALAGTLFMWWSSAQHLESVSVADTYMNAFCRTVFLITTATRLHLKPTMVLATATVLACVVMMAVLQGRVKAPVVSDVLVFVIPYVVSGVVLAYVQHMRLWRMFHLSC